MIANRLIEGNGQNQVKELYVLRYNVLVPFHFLFLAVILFVYFLLYLFSLGLCSFSVFKHVRLLDLVFVLSVSLFFGFRV